MDFPVLRGRSRRRVIKNFYHCFQYSEVLQQLCRSGDKGDLMKLFRWFDCGIASCCCRCFQLVSQSPTRNFMDAVYFLASVYIILVLPKEQFFCLMERLSGIKKLAFQLFALIEDDGGLEFFISCYNRIRKVTRNDITAKFLLLQDNSHNIFPTPDLVFALL